ncbi:MAG: putative phage tail protein [Anaerosporomusa subterranea]|jgi:hypothetical protein|nr:putative phage tail protein [Anaerosporomusa subterranea]
MATQQQLDTQITPESLERNFTLLNRILAANTVKMGRLEDLLTDEQKQRIKAMEESIKKVSAFISQRISEINNHVDELIITQQELAVSIDAEIRETLTSVEENIRNDTQNAIDTLDRAKVSDAEFTEAVNRLTQVDDENRSNIEQIPGKITLAVGQVEEKLNGAPSISYGSIAALKVESDNLSMLVQSNKQDADGKINTLSSDLNLVPGKITAAVTEVKGELTTKIAAVEVDIDGIHQTVADNQVDTDGKIMQQATRIDQLPEQINLAVTQSPTDPSNEMPNLANLRIGIEGLSSTVSNQGGQISALDQKADSIEATVASKANAAALELTNQSISLMLAELSKSPELCAYTAITMLTGLIDLCVKDTDLTGQEVISRINVSPEGVRISGKQIHITGDTVFDDDVIVAGALKVNSLSAIATTIGILRTAESGARTEIRDNLTLVYDANDVLRVRMGVWNE